MCTALPAEPDTVEIGPNDTVIRGTVSQGGEPVPHAYVRLLDSSGEFVAEVPTSATGHFRFYARPGDWTLRVLSARGSETVQLAAVLGANEVDVHL